MAQVNFDRCLTEVLKHEGGYVDHPADPGGATNRGITLATLSDWRGRNVTKAEVKALTRAEAAEIYRARYWNPVKGDALPPGLDHAVFDFAVNSGISRAAKFLQRIVKVDVDGKIGPQTLTAIRSFDAPSLIIMLCDDRLEFLRGLKTWPTFGKGWQRRVDEVRDLALKMAKGTVPVTKPPKPKPRPTPPPPAQGWLSQFFAALGRFFVALFK